MRGCRSGATIQLIRANRVIAGDDWRRQHQPSGDQDLGSRRKSDPLGRFDNLHVIHSF
jgi:hypothetical protein